jgi:hypothetical protein
MKFAPVMPAELYAVFDRGEYHMAQAHLIRGNTRALEWFRTKRSHGHVVILDNGVIETGKPNVKALFDVAREVYPTAIVCPDVLHDADATFNRFCMYGVALERFCAHVMVVPQGADAGEWRMSCIRLVKRAEAMLNNPPFIGVPKYLDRYMDGRESAIDWLLNDFGVAQTQIHLLGIHRQFEDVKRIARKWPRIAGVDSTLPVACGLDGTSLQVKRLIEKDAWRMTVSDLSTEQYSAIADNIAQAREWIKSWTNHPLPTAQLAPT